MCVDFKRFWDILKLDIMTFMQDFCYRGFIPPSCNSSFITLIPKVQDPRVIKYFRPISLIGVMYKILAKTLAVVVGSVVSI